MYNYVMPDDDDREEGLLGLPLLRGRAFATVERMHAEMRAEVEQMLRDSRRLVAGTRRVEIHRTYQASVPARPAAPAPAVTPSPESAAEEPPPAAARSLWDHLEDPEARGDGGDPVEDSPALVPRRSFWAKLLDVL